MNLNERISKIIEYSNLSSSEFADAVDVQRSSISHITSGRNKPSLEFIIKIKNKFPEIQWDWLITGNGEMISEENEEEFLEKSDEVRPTPLPHLYDMINREFEDDEQNLEQKTENINSRESNIPQQEVKKEKISDSQRLDLIDFSNYTQNSDTQSNKIKNIVIFYENGKFESFIP